ncbi:MAG: hypothetical protein AB7F86_02925 [Bdellovibrionales bacterium]
MDHNPYDSYRLAIGIFKFLLALHFVLLKLLLLWSQLALAISAG